MITTLALFGPIGTWEAIALLVIGLLIFGRRLPEVGRSLGRGIVEFRKGLKGVEDEIETESSRPGLPRPADTTSLPARAAELGNVPRGPLPGAAESRLSEPSREAAGN